MTAEEEMMSFRLVYIDGDAIAQGLRWATWGEDLKRWIRDAAQRELLCSEPQRLPWWNR